MSKEPAKRKPSGFFVWCVHTFMPTLHQIVPTLADNIPDEDEDVVSIAEAKQGAGLTHVLGQAETEDTLVQRLIDTAIEWIEQETDIALSPAIFEEHYAWWPDCFHLIKYPVRSVTWIKVYDTASVLAAWDTSNYIVTTPTRSKGGIDYAMYVLPPLHAYRPDAIQVRYVAGYTIAPVVAKQAICLLVRNLYFKDAIDDAVKQSVSDLLARVDYRGF